MKFSTATLAVGVLSAELVTAQPHRVRHAHRHAKKDVTTVVDIVDTVYVMATGPSELVMVHQDGVPYTTITEGMVGGEVKPWSTAFGVRPTPALEDLSSSSSSTLSLTTFATMATPITPVTPVAPVEVPAVQNVEVVSSSTEVIVSTIESVAPVTHSAPVIQAAAPVEVASQIAQPIASPAAEIAELPVQAASVAALIVTPEVQVQAAATPIPEVHVEVAVTSTAPATAASSSTSSGSSSGSGYGFSYSPYNGDGTCKSQTQVNSDFAKIGNGYSLVRTYGVDCNQVATVLKAAKSKGLKMFAGIYDLTDLVGAVKTISTAANGDWSSFDTISVGNEIVNGGGSAAQVIAAIGTVRGLLKTAGYTGKVVTVDTLVAARNNPGLCDASDVCTVNCHPFFDGKVTADQAGDFLETQIPTLQAVLANKNQQIVITETGWPWQGESNGVAIPSTANQAVAISSIKSKFASKPSSIILFTVFNDMWKKNTAAQFGAEQFWGFLGDSPSG